MTELQQKILFYIAKGYEAKEIGAMLKRGHDSIRKDLHLLRIEFKVKNTTQLIATLYCKGIMQEIEKEYL